jgi:hypothetical protein
MKITQFQDSNLRALRADINAALKQISEKHGIDMSIGTMSYSLYKTTCRITMETKKEVSASSTPSVNADAVYLSLFDLPADAFERQFSIQGTVFKLVGLKPNRPKNPCLIERVKDGKKFKCGENILKNALA